MRFTRTSVATALAVLIGVAGGVGLTGTASADTAPSLGLPGYADMVVDGAHGHVFVSGGKGSTAVVVTDLDGAPVTTLAGEPGAAALALSPDGGTLYVALPGSDAVSAVDTGTLTETARYSTGTGALDDPQDLAYTGGRLWFSYGFGWQGGVGSIDVTGAQPTVSLNGDNAWYTAPVLTSSPAAPGILVAGEASSEPSPVTVYDVSSGSPVATATRSDAGTFVADMAITADGEDVVVASGSPYYQQVYKLSDLSADGQYTTQPYPDAVAVAPDGTVAAGVNFDQPDIYLFAPRVDTPLRTLDVSSGGNYINLAHAALAWAPDSSRLFAVTTDVYGTQPTLHVLRDPTKTSSTLTLAAPQSGYPHQPVTISGQLTSDAPFTGVPTLQVTRTDPAHPGGIALADVPVAADGGFSFTDTPTVAGDHTYAVTYAGDAAHGGQTGTARVVVGKAPTALVLNGPASARRGSAVKLSGTITSPLPLSAGAALQVSRKDASGTVRLPAVTVSASGAFSFSDTPQVGGTDTYTVTYAGDGAHTTSVANHPVAVSRSATAVSVTANATNYAYAAKAKITAHLGTTYNGRTLAIYAQPYGGTKQLLTTGKADAHGNLSVTYQVTRRTSFTAAFAGDYRYAPATSAVHTIWSYAKVTDGMRGYYTSATISGATYRVYHHKTDPLTGAVVTPAKHNECVSFTAQVWASGAWHTVATASCVRTSATSQAWATLTGTHAIGYHYRFRAEYLRPASDPANLSTYGSWQNFVFRT